MAAVRSGKGNAVNVDDDEAGVGATPSPGRRLAGYAVIAVLAAIGAAALAAWLRARTEAALWESAPTGWDGSRTPGPEDVTAG